MAQPTQHWTSLERYMLEQRILSLDLPAIPDATDAELFERAHKIGYDFGDVRRLFLLSPDVREAHLRDLFIALGVLPASDKERDSIIWRKP
jgi:hypothetical protein